MSLSSDTPHYSPKQLSKLIRGVEIPDRGRVLEHFGRVCPDCWLALEDLAASADRPTHDGTAASRECPEEPGAPVRQALEMCLDFLATSGNEAARLKHFAELPAIERHVLAQACTGKDFCERALAFRRLLLEESRRIAAIHRPELIRRLEVTVGDLADPEMERHVPERMRALEALGLVYLAEDFRDFGDLPTARLFLRQAKSLLNKSPGYPEIRATYYEIKSAVAISQGDPVEAKEFLDLAMDRLQNVSIAERRAETLVRLGLVQRRLGDDAGAQESFAEAVKAIPSGYDSRLRFEALHYGAAVEVHRGDFAAAERLLEEAEPLRRKSTSPVLLAQRAWLWGVVLLEEQRHAEAEKRLGDALQRFRELGRAPDQVQVLTDLALVHCRTGNQDALVTVGLELVRFLDHADVQELAHRELQRIVKVGREALLDVRVLMAYVTAASFSNDEPVESDDQRPSLVN